MKQYLDAIKKFRPIDDTFMQVLFKDNEKLVKKVIQIVLNQTIEIRHYETQADLKGLNGSKSIRGMYWSLIQTIPSIILKSKETNHRQYQKD
ncbi:MAG: hypothetical protein SO178_02095 [Floccifex porci]|uniref:hypothetical protein n=1 Tax=Floccifex porci TaxID=2606629 RepID=UPI002A82D4CD|nr:hypothetical protein [Floccifex porci]MDY4796448.1 hypothetical protein [Floccifex porci]